MTRPVAAIEELRRAVRILNNCPDGFNECFSVSELLLLCRMMLASGWDITPNLWSQDQLAAALRGLVPQWDDKTGTLVPIPSVTIAQRWKGVKRDQTGCEACGANYSTDCAQFCDRAIANGEHKCKRCGTVLAEFHFCDPKGGA